MILPLGAGLERSARGAYQMIRKVLLAGCATVFLAVSSLTLAASPDQFTGAIESAQLLDALQLDGELFHVQGLEIQGGTIWVTSVDNDNHRGYIHEFDRHSGKLRRRLELTDGARYHPGGISIAGGSIWVPVAEMKAKSSAVLLEIDTATLQVRRTIHVADHLGCVAAVDGKLVAGNWDSKLLYVFDLASKHPEQPERIVPNPSQTRFQDMKFVDGHLVAGGNLTWLSGAVDWIEWPSLKLKRSLQSGAVGPVRPFGRGGPYTGEGMAITGRDLFVVPEDGPSRVFHFRLDS